MTRARSIAYAFHLLPHRFRMAHDQERSPYGRRRERSREHANLGRILQLRRGWEGEQADEQTHREPYPAEDRNTVKLCPGGVRRQIGEVRPDRCPGEGEDAELFAEEEPRRGAERHRAEQGRATQSQK